MNNSEPNNSVIAGIWNHNALVATTDFKFKSLCNWVVNTAVGCSHACRFCYVPSTSANKQKAALGEKGVNDPDAEWGNYVFVREFDEKAFRKSVLKAQKTGDDDLKPDGNRAVMFCSTTDPYQVIHHADAAEGRRLTALHQEMVRRCLEIIRDESTLNVRILTRSPLAKTDFALMKSFGHRLVFGMSLPTLDNKLARIYEPSAPSPTARLVTLQAAKEAGLHVYVAVAPTYPQCTEADLRQTLAAVQKLEPVTVFHEPINIRADNAARIAAHAAKLDIDMDTSAFSSTQNWRQYALGQLQLVEKIAEEIGLKTRLHLWPDQSLASKAMLSEQKDPTAFVHWLGSYWTLVSEWPTPSEEVVENAGTNNAN